MRPTVSHKADVAQFPETQDESRGRHSEADIPPLVTDPAEVARLEAANALAQTDALLDEIDKGVARRLTGATYRLRPSTILNLHRLAVQGIDRFAGAYRPGDVTISRSHHTPPPAEEVAKRVEDLCDFVDASWDALAPVQLAAHVLWQLCWIHPFTDGNGRTARAVAYLVLCVAYGLRLPGARTIPEQISEDRRPYYGALEAADRAAEAGAADVSELAAYLEGMLVGQLEEAAGS